MCFANTGGPDGRYGGDGALQSLREIADLGGDAISITPFAGARGLDAPELSSRWDERPEYRARAAVVVEQAHSLGLRVVVKPHVWIHGGWRGEIAPSDGWDRWFASYDRYILYWARFAEETGAEELVVGVELKSSSVEQESHWRSLIADVRAVYGGELTYAANWDEVERVPFWDALDYVGVQMFAPLISEPGAEYETLRAGAVHWLERFRAVARRVDRPLLVTEVGYKSIRDTALEPWLWPEQLSVADIDQGAQALAYCAILETFGQAEDVAGIYWWKWFTDLNATEEGPEGFWPRGKIAEDVLRWAWQ